MGETFRGANPGNPKVIALIPKLKIENSSILFEINSLTTAISTSAKLDFHRINY
jgi:hypothetical protein